MVVLGTSVAGLLSTPSAVSDPAGHGRSCGTCRACCRAPSLPELGKPMDVWCRHVNPDASSEHGCLEYAGRPANCRGFSCGWLLGMGEEDDRPDRLGVLMQPTIMGEHTRTRVLTFVEFRAGALRSARAQWLMARHAQAVGGGVVVQRRADEPAFRRVAVSVNGVEVTARSSGGASAAAKMT